MCNLHWCYTFCIGVTLFALVLHLNCTALSQSESSNFFMYIIRWIIKRHMTIFWINQNIQFLYSPLEPASENYTKVALLARNWSKPYLCSPSFTELVISFLLL